MQKEEPTIADKLVPVLNTPVQTAKPVKRVNPKTPAETSTAVPAIPHPLIFVLRKRLILERVEICPFFLRKKTSLIKLLLNQA